jgi:hypothetical protein
MNNELKNNNLEMYPIGTKVQSYDKDGYYVMKACGYVVKHLGGGHAIIKDFNGAHWSSVGIHNIYTIEVLN